MLAIPSLENNGPMADMMLPMLSVSHDSNCWLLSPAHCTRPPLCTLSKAAANCRHACASDYFQLFQPSLPRCLSKKDCVSRSHLCPWAAGYTIQDSAVSTNVVTWCQLLLQMMLITFQIALKWCWLQAIFALSVLIRAVCLHL